MTRPRGRSCLRCYQRKVKCDRGEPCANCGKTSYVCLYPVEPIRRHRASRAITSPSTGRGEESNRSAGTPIQRATPSGELGVEQRAHTNQYGDTGGWLLTNNIGKSRLITGTFWASLPGEVDDLQLLLDDSVEVLPDSLVYKPSTDAQDYILETSFQPLQATFYPRASDAVTMWPFYVANVDPILRLLHKPTINKMIGSCVKAPDRLDKETEALLLTICFASIKTLRTELAKELFPCDPETLVPLYEQAVQAALKRANLLHTLDIRVLQAFVIFLSCMSRDNPRTLWTLTCLAVRIALAMGLHQDGTMFGLSPFDTEMRRRLWWNICLLDLRSSEDHGSYMNISQHSFNTMMPLNINDADFQEDTVELKPLQGCTEMMLALIRFETWLTAVSICGNYPECHCQKKISLIEKQRAILILSDRLQSNYLRFLSPVSHDPLQRFSLTVAGLVITKLRIMVRQSSQSKNILPEYAMTAEDELFGLATQLLTFEEELLQDSKLQIWLWFCKTHIQWSAIAYVLSELCRQRNGPEVEKAWLVIEKVFHGQHSPMVLKNSGTSHPLSQLKEKAERFWLGRGSDFGEEVLSQMELYLPWHVEEGIGLDCFHGGLFERAFF